MHDMFYELEDIDNNRYFRFDLDSNERHALRPSKMFIVIVVIPLVIWLGWTIARRITFELTYPMASYDEDWSGNEVDPLSVYGTTVVLDSFGPFAQLAHYRDGIPLGDPAALLIWLASYHVDMASLWWKMQPLQLDLTVVLTMAARQAIIGLAAVRYSIQDAELSIREWLQRLEWLYGPMSRWQDLETLRREELEKRAKRDLWHDGLARSVEQHPISGVCLSPSVQKPPKLP